LRVDFNASGVTQSGWEPLFGSDTALGDSWSKTIFASIDKKFVRIEVTQRA
jgi:hypothetical protein